MQAIAFNYEQHAAEVKKWPEKHSFPFPPKNLLPDVGFVVEGSAVGFLYTTNSQMGWVEWVFSNPEKTKEQRSEALDLLFKLLELTAQNLGVKALFSASGFSSYAKILERNGFKETDKNISHYIKIVGS